MVRDRLRSTDLGATAGSLASKGEAFHIHGASVLYFISIKLLLEDVVVISWLSQLWLELL